MGGSFCLKERYELYSSTFPYISLAVLIVLKRRKTYTYMGNLLYPFDNYTWSILFGLMIYRSIEEKIFGKKFTKRLHIIPWLLSFIVIRSAYEGLIFKSLKEKHLNDGPQTIEEALSDGYKFITNSAAYAFVHHVPDLENNTIYIDSGKMEVVEIFVKSEEKLALILDDHFAVLFKNASFNFEDYYVFREPLFVMYTCIYFPKSSSLQFEFQNRLMELFLHGHLGKILKKYSVKELFKKAQGQHEIKAIPLKQLKELFYWFAILCGLSFCLFVLELLSNKFSNIKIFLDLMY
ncbi:uncharacterized protein LOC129908800 [Episyrphus balteatus]|uniref:uncharacterized protein LOC129908800 n=1 Tax=Episyrphus balteatus TaxID=286459 RepID=UPI002485A455|nr:uncharacterized protein LOC129908800 [Episyrphus balteatus]